MKRIILLLCIASVAGLTPMTAQAVEPTYQGQFNNPEEPALRPYKWLWSGVRALGYQTKKAFVEGNMNTPVIGTVETMRGVRKGTLELAESSFKGSVYAPIEKGRHVETHKLNEKVDGDLALSEISDLAVTWYYYPVLKVNDKHPLEDDAKVEARLDEAKVVREERREATAARENARMTEIERDTSTVRKVQHDRLGHRIPFAGLDGRPISGNLLKLAD